MKTLLSFLLAPLLVFASGVSNALGASNYVIFCAPGLDSKERGAAINEIQKFIAGERGPTSKGMKPGDTLQIFNAETLEQIGPELLIPKSARTPELQYEQGLPLVKAFLEFLKANKNSTAPANIPKIVSTYQEKITNKDAEVLIIGSPLYFDDVPAHDMRQGWLSDGYFSQPHSVTVFSVQNRENNLRGNSFRFCTALKDSEYGTENKNAHQDMVKRFWAIYLNKCGGRLVSFQSDITTAFRSLQRRDLQEIPHDFDPNDTEMVIRRSKTELLPETTTETHPVPSHEQENPARSNEDLVRAAAAMQSGLGWLQGNPAQFNETHKNLANLKDFKWKTRVALVWSTAEDLRDQDLDLYIRPKVATEELSFKRPETPEGRHIKDFPADSIAKYGFEIVDLHDSTPPGDLQIWVNAYSGNPRNGFHGEVRTLHKGFLSVHPIKISATSGNKGAEAQNRNRSKYWASIPVEQAIHPTAN